MRHRGRRRLHRPGRDDVFGVGEYHTDTPLFAVSSPAVILAAIAARTASTPLTSTASALSVLDPVRLLQDFAQLDLVSDGRGHSAYAEPFDIFGVDIGRCDEVSSSRSSTCCA
ncbi:LLM class flavin-dependent oxidoreductase [Streptomyces sp. NPDC060209]|uniref:LLM class flavin-dependent oxidoreductase n=1 Tax=Streptomyces sp. NPDC060209 TaxID=3347073 RepID=UPI00364DC15D